MLRCIALLVAVAALAACGGDGAPDEETAAEPWTLGRAMSQRRSYLAAAEVEGAIYVAGGMVGESGRPLATFQRFDPAANRWNGLPRLPEPLAAAAAAAIGTTIYVTGGQGERRESGRQVWAYEVEDPGWRAVAPLPAARFNHSAVALDGLLYVLGGFAFGEEHDEVFAYDPGADRWSLVTRLPRPNHAFGVVAFRGEIWAIGGLRGEETLREVWILDPRTVTWREGPALPRPMELLGAAVAGDEIHAVWEDVYQIYDAGTGRWRDGPRPLVTRHALEVFHVDGRIYTIGGCTTALVDSPVVERRNLP